MLSLVTAELVRIGLSNKQGDMEPTGIIQKATKEKPLTPTPHFLDLIRSKEQLSTFYSSISLNATIKLTSSASFFVSSELSSDDYDFELVSTSQRSKILNQRLSLGLMMENMEL